MRDPMMMPAGRYGRAALEQRGVWDSVKDHVVNARDLRSALAYVARQETPLGIVFDTDGARIMSRLSAPFRPRAIRRPSFRLRLSRMSATPTRPGFSTSWSPRSHERSSKVTAMRFWLLPMRSSATAFRSTRLRLVPPPFSCRRRCATFTLYSYKYSEARSCRPAVLRC
jgi:Bacterial extracellular solute-binding protein